MRYWSSDFLGLMVSTDDFPRWADNTTLEEVCENKIRKSYKPFSFKRNVFGDVVINAPFLSIVVLNKGVGHGF
jgi:hypothetical protein